MANIQIVTASGASIVLHPNASTAELIRTVRARVATTLGASVSRVCLLHGSHELHNSEPLANLLGEQIVPTITALVLPCSVKPSSYESNVIRYPIKAIHDHLPDIIAAYVKVGHVDFPQPSGINIHMMPFMIGDKKSVPEEFQEYWPLIDKCSGLRYDNGRVGFLTIEERKMKKGESQGKLGLHVEAPEILMSDGASALRRFFHTNMVCGHLGVADEPLGGIYMATNASDSCTMWNAQVDNVFEMVGHLGNVEHLRDFVGDGMPISANELILYTDTTPHEFFPASKDLYEQRFKIVTPALQVWYDTNWTKNRLGIVHEAHKQIIKGDTFVFDVRNSVHDTTKCWPLELRTCLKTPMAKLTCILM